MGGPGISRARDAIDAGTCCKHHRYQLYSSLRSAFVSRRSKSCREELMEERVTSRVYFHFTGNRARYTQIVPKTITRCRPFVSGVFI